MTVGLRARVANFVLMNDPGSGANLGWTSDLPRIPGYYWVRLPGYEARLDGRFRVTRNH